MVFGALWVLNTSLFRKWVTFCMWLRTDLKNSCGVSGNHGLLKSTWSLDGYMSWSWWPKLRPFLINQCRDDMCVLDWLPWHDSLGTLISCTTKRRPTDVCMLFSVYYLWLLPSWCLRHGYKSCILNIILLFFFHFSSYFWNQQNSGLWLNKPKR